MYVHATAKIQHITHDPARAVTEVIFELRAIGDSGEPEVSTNVSAALPGATDQQTLDATVNAAVADALAANGIALEPGRTLIAGARVV